MIMCCCFDVEKSYFLHKNVVIEPQTISNRKNLILKVLDEKTGKLRLLKWLFCMEATKIRCFLQHRSVISGDYCGQSQIVISKYHNIRSIRTPQRC